MPRTYEARLFVNRPADSELKDAGPILSPVVRLLVQTGDVMRPVCKLLLPRNDISFALLPYSAQGKYSYRLSTFRTDEREKKIHCVEEMGFESVPKMQFHASGKVHISAGRRRVGGTDIPPLGRWDGCHMATLDVDSFTALPVHSEPLVHDKSLLDQPLCFPEGTEAGRFVFYANAKQPQFADRCFLVFRAWDEVKGSGIFIGVAPRGQTPRITGGSPGGVVVIGGWNPDDASNGQCNLLSLRAL